MALRQRSYLSEKKTRKVSRKFYVLKPYLKKVKVAIIKGNDGYDPELSDNEMIYDVVQTAKAGGWKESEIVDNPRGAVNDVLSIWRSR